MGRQPRHAALRSGATLLVTVALLAAGCALEPVPTDSPIVAASDRSAEATATGPPGSVAAPADVSPLASTSPSASPAASSGRGRTGLPDPSRTPGATNPAVTPATLAATACRTGWTSSVRPPVSYTGTLKRRQILEYGYADRDPAHYQEDHLIPLSVGGAPSDPRNLWPEPLTASLSDGTAVGAEVKDGFEIWVHDRLCRGSLSLAEAQAAFTVDWIAAWEATGRP